MQCFSNSFSLIHNIFNFFLFLFLTLEIGRCVTLLHWYANCPVASIPYTVIFIVHRIILNIHAIAPSEYIPIMCSCSFNKNNKINSNLIMEVLEACWYFNYLHFSLKSQRISVSVLSNRQLDFGSLYCSLSIFFLCSIENLIDSILWIELRIWILWSVCVGDDLKWTNIQYDI